MDYTKEKHGMKYRNIFLIISSLYFHSYALSSSFSVYWNDAKIEVTKDYADVFLQKNKPTFIGLPSSKNYDFINNNYYFDLTIEDFSSIKGIELRFSSNKGFENYKYYQVPIFTDQDFNIIRSKRKTSFGISLANLRQKGKLPKGVDLNTATLYINSSKKNKVRISTLKEKKKKQKRAILSITFDDGYIDNSLAAEIMRKHNLTATAYIIPSKINKKGYLNQDELQLLKNGHNWDIQHHHGTPFTELEKNNLIKDISNLDTYFKKNKLNRKSSTHLAYPLGKWNEKVYSIVKKRYATARIAGGGIETLPPADLHLLKTYNVLHSTTPTQLREVIQRSKKANQWLILMFHYINESPKNDLEYSTENFKELMKIIKEEKISVQTINQVWKRHLK